jgi:membrane fusion protein, multidrug efflux system
MAEESPKPDKPEKDPKSPPSHAHSTDDRDAAHKKHSWWPEIIGLVVVLLIGVVLYRVIDTKSKPPPPLPPTQVTTTTAQKGDIGIYVEGLGAVTPIATINVPSQVTGQLTNVAFTEGQIVHAGDLLAEIDGRPYQAQLDSAQGQLTRDQALLSEAQMDLKRYQSAYEQKAIPQQQMEDQSAVVNQDTGTVKYDEGQIASAKVMLTYCHIISPVTGRVGLRLVDPGNIVLASSTNGIVVVTQLQPITVIFSVSEDDLPAIQHQLSVGNHMSVGAWDRAQQTNLATGSVLALDNQIDSGTGTVRIRSIFTNQDYALFPNQFVNAKLLLDTMRDQTLIPDSVIQRNGTNTFVYVLHESTNAPPPPTGTNAQSTNKLFIAEMRSVSVGVTDGDKTAVQGIDPGDLLAADNFNRLQDKAKVTPRRSGGPGAPGGTEGSSDNGTNRGGGAGRGRGRGAGQGGTNTSAINSRSE